MKFGQQYANQIRRHRCQATYKWHFDKVVMTIDRQKYYLWQVVDSDAMSHEARSRSYRVILAIVASS